MSSTVWLESPYVKPSKFGPVIQQSLVNHGVFQGKDFVWFGEFLALAILANENSGKIPHDSSLLMRLCGSSSIDEMVEEGWWKVSGPPSENKKREKGEPATLRGSTKDADACAVFVLPALGGDDVEVYTDWIEEARSIYKGVDVEAELHKAKFWLINNPGRSKTARGMARFMAGWLERAQNRYGGRK